MIRRTIPASNVGSSPGRTGRWIAACCAVSVRRGSITIGCSPRRTSSRRYRSESGHGSFTPSTRNEVSGLVPTNSTTSDDEIGWSPPCQYPWSAPAMLFAGWSTVTVV